MFILVLVIPIALGRGIDRLRRRNRRPERERRCAKCGYDLTGNLSCICPECGSFDELNTVSFDQYVRIRRSHPLNVEPGIFESGESTGSDRELPFGRT